MNDNWWVFEFIKEWASDNGMDLSNLIAALDQETQQDYEKANVVAFDANEIVSIFPLADGTFFLVGPEQSTMTDPLVCDTVILQRGDSCLAVLLESL